MIGSESKRCIQYITSDAYLLKIWIRDGAFKILFLHWLKCYQQYQIMYFLRNSRGNEYLLLIKTFFIRKILNKVRMHSQFMCHIKHVKLCLL